MESIDRFIDSIDYLPPMPRNLMQLLELLDRGDVDLEEVVQLIQYDPALTAQIMRLCNSAYLGGAEPAADLHEATARLGFNEVFQLAAALTTAALIQAKQHRKDQGLETTELWRHCITAAVAGKMLAIDREEQASLVFTTCILHDLGKAVVARGIGVQYEDVLAESRRSQRPLFLVERAVLGFDHAQVGGRLLERWNFPAPLVQAVRFHHDPAAAGDHGRLAAYAFLGNLLAGFMGNLCGDGALALAGRTEAMKMAGATEEDLARCMTKAFYALRETQALLTFPF
jgi:HD-like signal output (HDOD) protein